MKKSKLILPSDLEKALEIYLLSLKKHIVGLDIDVSSTDTNLQHDKTSTFLIKKDSFWLYQQQYYSGEPWEWIEHYFKKSVLKLYDFYGIDIVKKFLVKNDRKFWHPEIHDFLMLDYVPELALGGPNSNIIAYHTNHFLKPLIEKFKPRSLLDMNYVLGDYAFDKGLNSFLACTSEKDIFNTYKGIFGPNNIYEVPSIDDNDNFESCLEKINQKFDLIICSPPLTEKVSEPYGSSYGRYLRQAIKKAKKKSLIVFIAPSRFIFRKSFKNFLQEASFYLNGLLEIDRKSTIINEEGFYDEYFSVYIFSNKNTESFFNSDLAYQNQKMNELIFNEFFQFYNGQKAVKTKISDLNSYVGYKNSKWNLQLSKKFKGTKVSEIHFNEAISEINSIEKIESELTKYSEKNNSVYIKKDLNSSYFFNQNKKISKKVSFATNDLNEVSDHRDYIQISLKEEYNSYYVAEYFNTKIGIQTLKTCLESLFLFRLDIDSIRLIKVYFPGIKLQRTIFEHSNQLKILRQNLIELDIDLWTQKLYNDETLIKRIEKVKSIGDSLEKWIDTLPFPLSSSLYIYITSNDIKIKHHQLLRFFESYTQFIVVLIVSALSNDKDFYQKHKTNISLDYSSITNSGFGDWLHWYDKLRKFIKSNLEHKEEGEKINHLISRGNNDFLKTILNGQIIDILNKALKIRNTTRGHGGNSHLSKVKRELELLEKHFFELRKRIKYGLEDIKIIVPGKTMEYENNLFKYSDCKELVGKGNPFNEIMVDSIDPLKKNELYCIVNDESSLIKILPFIKYREEKKAIYYYSRIEIGDLKYISHHYEEEDDFIIQKSKEIDNVLEYIFRK